MSKAIFRKADSIIARQLATLEKLRDKLDDDIGTLEQLKDDCEEAADDLQRARDALSRYV